jgi:hypothetical protein
VTLCLAAKYPFSYLENFPTKLSPGILFVSDSRLTSLDGSKDVVEKTITLCGNAMISVAGEAHYQFEVIKRITNILASKRLYRKQKILEIVESTYKQVFSLKQPQASLSFLGIIDSFTKKPHLFKIVIVPGIKVEEIHDNGIFFIGSRQEEHWLIESEVAIRTKKNPLPFYPQDWLSLFVQIFEQRFNSHPDADKTVGGIIQAYSLFPEGVTWLNYAELDSFSGQVLRLVTKENNRWKKYLNKEKVEETLVLQEIIKIL